MLQMVFTFSHSIVDFILTQARVKCERGQAAGGSVDVSMFEFEGH